MLALGALSPHLSIGRDLPLNFHPAARPVYPGKAAIEQGRGHDRAAAQTGRAQNHRNELAAVPARARHEIPSGGAGKPGFHAVGARIAAEQIVVIWNNLAAEPQGADVEEIWLLGKGQVERAREDCKVRSEE